MCVHEGQLHALTEVRGNKIVASFVQSQQLCFNIKMGKAETLQMSNVGEDLWGVGLHL